MDVLKSSSQRIQWIDALKLFAIFLVLWGHCVQHLLSSNHYDEPVYRLIYTFHMPLFMMISGFFSARLGSQNFFPVLVKKFRQLLLPVISICSIWLIINYLGIGGGHPFEWFWFLKSAFICSILFLIVSKTGKYFWVSLILSLVLSFFIRTYQVHKMYPCFVLGVMLNRYFDWFEINAKKILLVFGTLFISFVIGAELRNGLENKYFGFDINPFRLRIAKQLLDVIYPIVMGICGSIAFFALFSLKLKKCNKKRLFSVFSDWGKHTLGIYIFQTFILEFILRKYINFDNTNFFIFNFIIAPLISLGVMLLCLQIIKILKLSKLTNLLFLGQIEKTNVSLLEQKGIN